MAVRIPTFDYDERYFADCGYMREESFELQNEVLSVISLASIDIRKDLKTKIKKLTIYRLNL